jgi:hypothetical protein
MTKTNPLQRLLRCASLLGCAWAGQAAQAADNCDAVREGIEKKIRANGVAEFALEVIDAAASAPGKVVGSCARGTRTIVYRRGDPGAAAAPAAPAASIRAPAPVITECKDGSTPVNGQCPTK